VAGLTRRQFLKAAGIVGATSAFQLSALAGVLDGAFADPGGAGTTLAQTIRLLSASGYSKLGYAPGEPFLVREDLGAGALSTRTQTRRSLLYIGHHSDTHVLDAQSPARLEPGDILYRLGAGSAFRPNETLTVQVLDQMIRATNGLTHSTVTGAPMAFCLITGDLTDSNTAAEHRWLIDTYDGREVTPNTGGPGYEGVQVWSEVPWAYHPEGGVDDPYLGRGFPTLPGLLDAATAPVDATGVAVPWYAVFGNHDLIWQGTVGRLLAGDILSESKRKPTDLGVLVQLGMVATWRISRDVISRWWNDLYRPGTRIVTPDPQARRMIQPAEFMAGMFDTDPAPGPLGHGFDDDNLSSGRTWWARNEGPCRIIGMDSCNHFTGSEGSITTVQYNWLESELMAASTRYYDDAGNLVHNPAGTDRLILLFSHHNSWTMTNTAFDPAQPFPRRFGWDVVDLIRRFPNVVAWINGHSHENRINAHANPFEPGAGFWEVNTASCIDFGQHQRTVELVDNRDGTLSLFTPVVDHASHPDPGTGAYSTARLGSISRELSANDPFGSTGFLGNVKPTAALGKPEDRNCELVVRSPFDLGGAYSDAAAELDKIAWEAKILAR